MTLINAIAARIARRHIARIVARYGLGNVVSLRRECGEWIATVDTPIDAGKSNRDIYSATGIVVYFAV